MSEPEISEPTVKKRCVFFLGGYEPIPPQRQHERYIRELARSEKAWSANAEVGPLEVSPDGRVGLWRTTTRGPNWSTDAEYRSLLWHDIVLADFARPAWRRVLRSAVAFGDFILTGTAFRYLAVNWRYGLFFLYPVILLVGFAALAAYAAIYVVGLGLPLALSAGPADRIGDFLDPDCLARAIPVARLHDGRLDFRTRICPQVPCRVSTRAAR